MPKIKYAESENKVQIKYTLKTWKKTNEHRKTLKKGQLGFYYIQKRVTLDFLTIQALLTALTAN